MTPWRHFILGCSVGNVLEWYDFILYGYFAPILAHLFFPAANPYISLLLTFSVFASGCLMRPLGALMFGHIGDTFGRKYALIVTIIIITCATTLIGLLPTYQDIGLLAPVLLTFSRLMQGLAVSGEEVGAAVFLTENAPKNRQALAGSIVLGSVYIGLLLGALSAFATTGFFSHSAVMSGAWRIPFLLSFIFGIIALIIRLKDSESPVFLNSQKSLSPSRTPIRKVFQHHMRAVGVTLILSAVFAVAIYLFVVYLPTYLKTYVGFSMQVSLLISVCSLVVVALVVPFIGMCADYFGPKRLFFLGSVGFVVFSYPIFCLILHKTFLDVMLAEVLFAILLAMLAGSIFPLLVHLFPVGVRYTGIGLGFNVAMTIFGGTAPIMALNLIKFSGQPISPFWLLVLMGVLSLMVLPLASEQEEKFEDRNWMAGL